MIGEYLPLINEGKWPGQDLRKVVKLIYPWIYPPQYEKFISVKDLLGDG
jgi:hypothetical protein